MPLYLYCFTDPGIDAPSWLVGVIDAPVQSLTHARAGAWFSPLDNMPVATVERIERHNHVIDVAMQESGAVVPVRFGQSASDADRLRAHLEQHEGYAIARERVRDCVEYAIRLLVEVAQPDVGDDPAVSDATGGAAYLRQRARELGTQRQVDERARAAARQLELSLEDLIRARRFEEVREPAGATLAHLVQRRDRDAYAERARRAAGGLAGTRAFVTGPWPPYSFVSGLDEH